MSQEIEAKFVVIHLEAFRGHLLEMGGRLIRDRVLERNWRFDTEDGDLRQMGKVLRLRRDVNATITYKEGTADPDVRREIEFEVSDPDQARAFLEALGYQIVLIYEKYREVFRYKAVEVALDQLPFGSYVELEGPSRKAVKEIAIELGLEWSERVRRSYAELFNDWRTHQGTDIRDATFEALQGFEPVTPATLGLADAFKAPDRRKE
ncbi:MAG: class IV adenylate cyclase [Anaerolineales bacterium]